MAYAIHRAGKKIKAWAQVAQVAAHNTRQWQAWNVDEDRSRDNIVIVGSGDLRSDIQKCMDDAGIDPARIRSNACLAQEFILTASPEFFVPQGWRGPGRWDPQRVEAWRTASMAFLDQAFGRERLAHVVLHLDETSPHIHAICVPLHQRPRRQRPQADEPQGQQQFETVLSAKAVWGGRKKFQDRQTLYATKCRQLGLRRGVLGSKRRHKSMKEYYARLRDVEAFGRELAQVSDRLMDLAATLVGTPREKVHPATVSQLVEEMMLMMIDPDRVGDEEERDQATR